MANRGYWTDGAVWFSADNLNGMLLQYGNTASRSDFGQQGRVHFNTQTGVESYDTGSAWVNKQWGTGAYRGDSITLAKMAVNSVDTEQLVTASVTQAKMAANSVGNAQMRDASVGTLELIDGSVTDAKINGMNASKLTGTISTSRFPSSRPRSTISSSTPSSSTGSNGDVWLEY